MTNPSAKCKVFFDSMVWIKYLWIQESPVASKSDARKGYVPLDKIQKGKATIVITEYLLYEISQHFKDWLILQKVISDGYSYREFVRRKKEDRDRYRLDKSEKKDLDGILLKIAGVKACGDILIKPLTRAKIERLLRIISRCDLEFIDALHLLTLQERKCNIFVSRDSDFDWELITRAYPSYKKINFYNPNEFKGNILSKLT